MKTRMITAVLIFFIAASVLTAGSSKKMMTIDEAMEVVCGTWINNDYLGTHNQRVVFHSDGTYVIFTRKNGHAVKLRCVTPSPAQIHMDSGILTVNAS
jgi:hypothetical protein